jgi:hypothetical protein
MSGISRKTPHPTWQWVMDRASWATVAEMSRASDVSDSACRDYVFEGKIPGLDAAARIAWAAGVKLDELAKRLVI